MQQYTDLCRNIVQNGVWSFNERTQKRCKVLLHQNLHYGADLFPIVTTRKSYWKQAVAELIGYLRGYSCASEFRAIGCNTWDANANYNPHWLANPHRLGKDDMGRVYGVQLRDFHGIDGSVDQLKALVEKLQKGEDDRGLILTFWHPAEFHLGCLRPCMHTHTFSLLGDTLHLSSTQRSADVPLGLNFNMIQAWVLLKLICRITDLKMGGVHHHIVNAHIYDDQYEQMADIECHREPFAPPTMTLSDDIRTLDDILLKLTPDHFQLSNYNHHEPIHYPFAI